MYTLPAVDCGQTPERDVELGRTLEHEQGDRKGENPEAFDDDELMDQGDDELINDNVAPLDESEKDLWDDDIPY
jgi:hypothetical protein